MRTKNSTSRKNYRIDVRLTGAEHSKIDNMYKISTCRTKAQYVRELIFNRPVRIFYRDQSLDDLIEEIVILNREINILKEHQSKTLEILYTYKNSSELNESIQLAALKITGLHKKMDEVKNQMEKITEKWLQS